jgi:hypothetical protein
MNKQLLFIAISVFAINAAEEKKEEKINRSLTIGDKTADITEHISDYFKEAEKYNELAEEVLALTSPQSQKWGLTSYIFGSSKPVVKVEKQSKKFDIVKSMKIHGFNIDAQSPSIVYSIKSKDEFLKVEPALRNNNFKYYAYKHLKSDQSIHHIFIGAMAQQDALNYYFAQKIAKIMGFDVPAYVLNENNNQKIQHKYEYDKYHAYVISTPLLYDLFSYVCTQKKLSLTEPITSSEKNFLLSFQLFHYDKNKLSFTLLTQPYDFKQSHLSDILQGKYYISQTYTSAHSDTSSRVSEGKTNDKLTRVFIGEGVSDKTPHDYFIEQMKSQ